MTAPVTHGYPDWGRYSARADKVLFNEFVTDIDAVTSYGRFFVGDSPAIGFWINVSTNHIQMNLDFYETETSADTLGSHTYVVREGMQSFQSVAVLGPWLTIRMTPSAVNSAFWLISWTASIATSSNDGSPLNSILVSGTGVAVGALGTVNTDATNVIAGFAHMFVSSGLASWVAYLEAIDITGVAHLLSGCNGNTGGIGFPVILPPLPVRIRFVNLTAGAGTFDQALVVKTQG